MGLGCLGIGLLLAGCFFLIAGALGLGLGIVVGFARLAFGAVTSLFRLIFR